MCAGGRFLVFSMRDNKGAIDIESEQSNCLSNDLRKN